MGFIQFVVDKGGGNNVEERNTSGKSRVLSTVSDYVTDVDYPAWKEDFIIAAEDSEAPTEVLKLLESLPDEEYGSREEFEDTLHEITQGK